MGNKFFPALESTRGLAALFVVCYHWKTAEFITKNGYLGVDLFFVISRYIEAIQIKKPLNERLLKNGITKRYPLTPIRWKLSLGGRGASTGTIFLPS